MLALALSYGPSQVCSPADVLVGRGQLHALGLQLPPPCGQAPSGEAVALLLVTALVFQARLWCFHGETGLCVPGITQQAGFGDWCACDDFTLLPLHGHMGCRRGTGVALFAIEGSRHRNESSGGELDLVCAHLCMWH